LRKILKQERKSDRELVIDNAKENSPLW